MNIMTREVYEIKIVDLDGKLDTSTAPDVEKHLNQLLSQNTKKLLVNLQKVDYVSSAGLRILLVTAKKLKSTGGEMRICSLNEVIQEIFDISGFSSIFKILRNETEAVDGF